MLYVNPYAGNIALMHGKADSTQREKVALQEFEQVFLRELMKSMRATVPDGGLFPKSQQSSFFNDMLDDTMARTMAQSGQLGVAKQIEAQLEARRSSMKDSELTTQSRLAQAYAAANLSDIKNSTALPI
jgi:flagellar protein FlgJ